MTALDYDMPTMATDLGTLIANERQRLRWAQRDITAHGGPSHNAISMIESGKTLKPDASTLWKIAVAFTAGARKLGEQASEGEWFARLLRVAGYPLDAQADAVVAKLVGVLDTERRRQILDMTAEDIDLLFSLWSRARAAGSPPQ